MGLIKRLFGKREPKAPEGAGEVSVSAVITRADGTVEDLGVLGSAPMIVRPGKEEPGGGHGRPDE